MALPNEGSTEVYGHAVVLRTCRLDIRLEVSDPETDDPERDETAGRDADGSELLISVTTGSQSLADVWLTLDEDRNLLTILDHLLFERVQAEVP
jgi:hypothetical protein